MKCTKCGYENSLENIYCEECDWRLDQTYKGREKDTAKKKNQIVFAGASLVVGVIVIALGFVENAEISAVVVGAVGIVLGSYSVNLPRYLHDSNKGICMALAGIGMILSVFGFILGLTVYAGVF